MSSFGFKTLVIATLFGSIVAQNETLSVSDPLFHESSLIHLLSNMTKDHLTSLNNTLKPQPDSIGKLFEPTADDSLARKPFEGTNAPDPTVDLHNDSLNNVKVVTKVIPEEPVKIEVSSTPDSTRPANGSGSLKPEASLSHVSAGAIHPDSLTSGAELPPHVLAVLQDHHDNLEHADRQPAPEVPKVPSAVGAFPQHTPPGSPAAPESNLIIDNTADTNVKPVSLPTTPVAIPAPLAHTVNISTAAPLVSSPPSLPATQAFPSDSSSVLLTVADKKTIFQEPHPTVFSANQTSQPANPTVQPANPTIQHTNPTIGEPNILPMVDVPILAGKQTGGLTVKENTKDNTTTTLVSSPSLLPSLMNQPVNPTATKLVSSPTIIETVHIPLSAEKPVNPTIPTVKPAGSQNPITTTLVSSPAVLETVNVQLPSDKPVIKTVPTVKLESQNPTTTTLVSSSAVLETVNVQLQSDKPVISTVPTMKPGSQSPTTTTTLVSSSAVLETVNIPTSADNPTQPGFNDGATTLVSSSSVLETVTIPKPLDTPENPASSATETPSTTPSPGSFAFPAINISLPLFPPTPISPMVSLSRFYTGFLSIRASIVKTLFTNPFKEPEPEQTNVLLNSVTIAMATPFVTINSKVGAILVVISSTLAIPVVKAQNYYAIPFFRGPKDKETVPLFVVTDTINSFSLNIDAPDIKPSIQAGQLIVVARTPATEKLLEPLLSALQNVNPNVKEQTIILQPVHKAQTSDNTAMPSDIYEVVREVRKALNLETMSERMNSVVENLRMTVTKAHESVTSTVTSSFGNLFATQQDTAADKGRGSQSAPLPTSTSTMTNTPVLASMPTKNEYSIPTVWSRTNDSVQPSVSNNYNVPHLEEVDHNSLIEEVGAASPANRGKRDVSGFVVDSHSAPLPTSTSTMTTTPVLASMPTTNEYSIPTVWSGTNNLGQPSLSNNYNVPHLEEVSHNSLIEEVGAALPASRGKRDVSGYDIDAMEEVFESTNRQKRQIEVPLMGEVHIVLSTTSPQSNSETVTDAPAVISTPVTSTPAVVATPHVISTPISTPGPFQGVTSDVHTDELMKCGAHLTQMSTSECHRSEVYLIKSGMKDSAACKHVAQQDLLQLIAVCHKPERNFMCNMKSKEKKETEEGEDGKKMTQHFYVYTFSIVRIIDDSHACTSKLKFVYEKQLSGEAH